MTSVGYWANSIFRIGYGAFFVFVGLYGGYSLVSGGGNPFSVEPGPGANFQAALEETGFIVPLMLICFTGGGSALAFRRTAPLGIVLLAPFVVVIFFYHVLLGGSALWAIFWAAGLAFLAYTFRERLGVLAGLSLSNVQDH